MVISRELNHGFNMVSGSAKSIEDGLDVSTWLHGNDSKLVLLVDPDEESLGIVVENTSAGWPVSVKIAGLKESVTLLEEEVIVDERFLIFFAHTIQWIEFTLKISLEGVASLDDLIHDLESLCFGDAWTEWVVGHVSANSDSGRVHHCHLIWSKIGVLKTLSSHVRNVFGVWCVIVIVLDDLVEKLVELVVSVV